MKQNPLIVLALVVIPLGLLLIIPSLWNMIHARPAPAFDTPALVGKTEPQVKAALGTAFLERDNAPRLSATDATKQRALALRFKQDPDEAIEVWKSKDNQYQLLVTYNNRSKHVKEFSLVALATKRPERQDVLSAGNLSETDPRYSLTINQPQADYIHTVATVTPH